MYIVTYKGKFAFIKPWTAVRDCETFSQQFLTPSIIEGIEKKLFPELLHEKGIRKILRHKLAYESMSSQQEVTYPKNCKNYKSLLESKSVLKRVVFLHPTLYLAFENLDDAKKASKQHICLCRNEDILLPEQEVISIKDSEFNKIPGFELRFGRSEHSFLVGFNRFDDSSPMFGRLEYNGKSL